MRALIQKYGLSDLPPIGHDLQKADLTQDPMTRGG